MASQVYFEQKWMMTQECVVCVQQEDDLVVVGSLTKSPSHSAKTVIDKVAHQTVTFSLSPSGKPFVFSVDNMCCGLVSEDQGFECAQAFKNASSFTAASMAGTCINLQILETNIYMINVCVFSLRQASVGSDALKKNQGSRSWFEDQICAVWPFQTRP
jgi:hypothetical protein